MNGPVLQLENVAVTAHGDGASVALVRDVSLSIGKGEIHGLVGESGSGKSLTVRAITRVLPRGLHASGAVRLSGRDVTELDAAGLRGYLASDVATVFQDPRSHVNPVHKVGNFLAEGPRFHGRKEAATTESIERVLRLIGIADPARVVQSYPHELSGGLLQRVMIASALLMRPKVLLADEPTTALDVTTQAEVIKTLVSMRDDYGMSLLLITHDLDLAASICDRISVMYAGSVVETRSARDIYSHARHPYSQGLVRSRARIVTEPSIMPVMFGRPTPSADAPEGMCPFSPRCWAVTEACRNGAPELVSDGDGLVRCIRSAEGLDPDRSVSVDERHASPVSVDAAVGPRFAVEIEELHKTFRGGFGRTDVEAVRGVSFTVPHNSCVAIVGESGSGKTTIGRIVLGLESASSGRVLVGGEDWTAPARGTRARRARARRVQMIFQDPLGSLDRSQSIRDAMTEVRQVHFDETLAQSTRRGEEICDIVGLSSQLISSKPQRLSGGQRQRAAIARALAIEPSLLILDEPASALDVSIQASIINLLNAIRAEQNLTYLLISHDLGVVSQLAEHAVVMKRGQVVERAPIATLVTAPQDDYTRTLLNSVPVPQWTRRERLDLSARQGEVV